jgi:hypothetical protein
MIEKKHMLKSQSNFTMSSKKAYLLVDLESFSQPASRPTVESFAGPGELNAHSKAAHARTASSKS